MLGGVEAWMHTDHIDTSLLCTFTSTQRKKLFFFKVHHTLKLKKKNCLLQKCFNERVKRKQKKRKHLTERFKWLNC